MNISNTLFGFRFIQTISFSILLQPILAAEPGKIIEESAQKDRGTETLIARPTPFTGSIAKFQSGCLVLSAAEGSVTNCNAPFSIKLEAKGIAEGVLDNSLEIVIATWKRENESILLDAEVRLYCSVDFMFLPKKTHKDYAATKACLDRRQASGSKKVQIRIMQTAQGAWLYKLSTENNWRKSEVMLSPFVRVEPLP